MYLPDLETYRREADQGRLVPVYRDWRADLETPVSVFLKLAGKAPAFLLESVEGGQHLGRYSFIGINPSLVVETRGLEGTIRRGDQVSRVALGPYPQGPDPLHLVQNLLSQRPVVKTQGLPRFFGGAVGYVSYDTVRFFERLPECPQDQLGLPDCLFMFPETLVIFDHVQHRMKIVTLNMNGPVSYTEARDRIDAVISDLDLALPPEPQAGSGPVKEAPEFATNFTYEEYREKVLRAKEYILAGDIFQVVPSRRLWRTTAADSFTIYRALRMLNPSPYMFYLDFGPFQLIGSSPETLVRLEEGQAETRPIAGTRPRGASDEEDERIIADLLADPKERAEHVMLVDLGRNDLGRVCRYGTVQLPLYMTTEKYSHVIHIVSSVTGELKPEYDAFSLLRACFPAGTVSGAPKIRAMEIIAELEGLKRGPYAGAVGYFGFGGNMDTCITIRTIVRMGDTVYLQAGGGVVADSDPRAEYEETRKKMEVLGRAVRLAEGSGTF
jgi:anthranilate synthase component 1